MSTQYKYRIEERTLSNGNKEFMPQRLEVPQRQSVFTWLFDRQPKQIWSNIADFQNQEYDRGYSSMERAIQDITNDKAKRITVVAVHTIYDDELHGIQFPYD